MESHLPIKVRVSISADNHEASGTCEGIKFLKKNKIKCVINILIDFQYSFLQYQAEMRSSPLSIMTWEECEHDEYGWRVGPPWKRCPWRKKNLYFPWCLPGTWFVNILACFIWVESSLSCSINVSDFNDNKAKVLRPLDVGISNRFSILLMLMVLKLLPLLNMITTTQRR